MRKLKSNNNFRETIILITVLIGAGGSLVFMFNASRNQRSILLIALFTIWVLSPFIGLLIGNRISKRWSALSRATFYWLTIVLTIGSLVVYSGILNPPGTKAGFIFLVVPFASWVVMGTVILITRKISHGNRKSK
jgi:hypothetical protein